MSNTTIACLVAAGILVLVAIIVDFSGESSPTPPQQPNFGSGSMSGESRPIDSGNSNDGGSRTAPPNSGLGSTSTRVNRAKWSEAEAVIGAIRRQLAVYKSTNGSYDGLQIGPVASSSLGMTPPESTNFRSSDYAFSTFAADGSYFVITVRSSKAGGPAGVMTWDSRVAEPRFRPR